ncbi:pyridoxal phosphate-dependent transferase [Radiomyces spectabilis]|uniref:pyridoxal phosphate-dependent transferase n=1 Tax=Radiomyces spectabilis TaxID=64574 RepID=UPI00221FB0C6|nr:pyridoxal phosphate-dependent transferase [Radiomyces spectabilis]KAI8380998.1 pyridoxal phosphate-dependent transferase [Radiomyces spectabilis]
MTPLDMQLEATLAKRRKIAKIRRLVVNPEGTIDFSSNDFLGLAYSQLLRDEFLQELHSMKYILGSTGSRLLDGNSKYVEDLEHKIAQFHKAEAALIFNSGFDANSGLFSTLPQKGDIIIYDELVHASVHEGMRMSRASHRLPFKHSDIDDLKRILEKVVPMRDKNVFIAVETVYSMDGDVAPLQDIVDLLKYYWPHRDNGYLVVDEAHGTGVYGKHGRGVVNQLGLEKDVFARLHTFSKALASNGAVILGSKTLREYLINYARPLIYSTFMPYSSLALIKCAYSILGSGQTEPIQDHLKIIIQRFRDTIRLPVGTLLASSSPIQGVVLNGNEAVRALAGYLNRKGFIVKPICSPTVPKGQERVRICLHGHNTLEQVDSLVASINMFFDESDNPIVMSSENTIVASRL